jgi:DNA-binding response OmpR family regulator
MDAMSVLVVDDDPLMLELTCRVLRSAGHAAHAAISGEAALRWMEHRRPRLIVLDAKMPGLDGFGLLRRLKGDAALRDVPVVMLTGSRAQADVIQARNLGASGYVVKPFTTQTLLRRLAPYLETRRDGAVPSDNHEAHASDEPSHEGDNWLI